MTLRNSYYQKGHSDVKARKSSFFDMSKRKRKKTVIDGKEIEFNFESKEFVLLKLFAILSTASMIATILYVVYKYLSTGG